MPLVVHFKKLIGRILLLPLILALNGCVYLVVGGLGAVGGYVVSPDTVEGVALFDDVTVWDAAVETMSLMGIIEEESQEAGMIIGRISGAKITLTVIAVGDEHTRLRIKARKYIFPKMSLSQAVYVKIFEQLNL